MEEKEKLYLRLETRSAFELLRMDRLVDKRWQKGLQEIHTVSLFLVWQSYEIAARIAGDAYSTSVGEEEERE